MSFTTFETFIYTPLDGPPAGDPTTLEGHFSLPDPPKTTASSSSLTTNKNGISSTSAIASISIATATLSQITSAPSSSKIAGPQYEGDSQWPSIPTFIVSLIESEAHTQAASSRSHDDSGISGASIAGVVIGAIALVIITIALFYAVLQQRRSHNGPGLSGGGRSGSREGVLPYTRAIGEEQGMKQNRKSSRLRCLLCSPFRTNNTNKKHRVSKAELPGSVGTTGAGSSTLVDLQSPSCTHASTVMPSEMRKARAQELSGTQCYEMASSRSYTSPMENDTLFTMDSRLAFSPIALTASVPKRHPAREASDEINDPSSSKQGHGLNAHSSSPDRNSPQPPQLFPYEGLLSKYVEKRH